MSVSDLIFEIEESAALMFWRCSVVYYLGLHGKCVSHNNYTPALVSPLARLSLYMRFWSRAHLMLGYCNTVYMVVNLIIRLPYCVRAADCLPQDL